MPSKNGLQVGVAEINITPPIGVAMVGALTPRPSTGIDDPLLIKALVVQSGETTLAVVALDLAFLPRYWGDRCVRLASEQTGIPAEQIVWCATHTHTGPIADAHVYPDGVAPSDLAWLEKLPGQFAQAVSDASARRRPARLSRCRTFCLDVASSRRIRFKNGLDLNCWNLGAADTEVQSLGFASHVDPEVNALCFDSESGTLTAVIWTFACHTNANFGPHFSADYPAVVAEQVRQKFGANCFSLFLPGPCGDVNPLVPWKELGKRMADVLIPAIEARRPVADPLPIQALKRDITIPARPFRPDEEWRRRVSGWSPDLIRWFEWSESRMKELNQRQINTVLQAWRIGDIGFISVPGELFVERGLDLKRLSPFPWTYPIELGGDSVGYLVTHAAEQSVGYESLHCWVSRLDAEGVDRLIEGGLDLLKELRDSPPV